MLWIDLLELDRAGSLTFDELIPRDHSLWEGVDVALKGAVHVDLSVRSGGAGQVVARGRMHVPTVHACRRCLTRVDVGMEEELSLVWAVVDQLASGGKPDDEVRPLDPGATRIDMGAAIREELILAAPRYVVCGEGCRGLCPRCGTNRNEATCDCTVEEPDPRWEALRALQNE